MKRDNHKEENAKRIMKQAGYSCNGYAKGGAIKEEKKEEKKEDKKKDHKVEHKKEGGFVHGGMPKKRLDKISRQTDKTELARGGKVGKKGGKTQVNILIGKDGAAQPAPGGGMPIAPAMPPHPMPAPPMAPPPGAGLPPGAGMPPRPGGPPPMKRGGKVPDMEYGAGGGEGRLEKRDSYGPKPRARGGKTMCD